MSETVIRLNKEKDELAARCSELEEQNKCLLAEVTELRSCIDHIMPHNEKLKAENQYMREEKAGIEMELQRLRAQLEIVHLIFGRGH